MINNQGGGSLTFTNFMYLETHCLDITRVCLANVWSFYYYEWEKVLLNLYVISVHRLVILYIFLT